MVLSLSALAVVSTLRFRRFRSLAEGRGVLAAKSLDCFFQAANRNREAAPHADRRNLSRPDEAQQGVLTDAAAVAGFVDVDGELLGRRIHCGGS